MADYDIFREQLSIKHSSYGHALWEPSPAEPDNPVKVGDVGFIRNGKFHCFFNALLPADGQFVPEPYEKLVPKYPKHISKGTLCSSHYCSHGIGVEIEPNIYATGADDFEKVSFSNSRRRGAVLSLPVDARREDTLALDDFSQWILKNIDHWFAFARGLGLGIERMEEIILVTGCDLTRSSTNVAFYEHNAQVSLGVKVADSTPISINWRPLPASVQGAFMHRGPGGSNLPEDQCIFIRGFRVARTFWKLPKLLKAAAGISPDEDEHDYEPDIEVVSIPATAKYPDPLHLLKDYVAERAPDCDMVLVHDADLVTIDELRHDTSLETLEPDVIIDLLRESNVKIHKVSCDLSPTNSGSNTERSVVKVAMLSMTFQKLNAASQTQLSEEPIVDSGRVDAHRSKQHFPDIESRISMPFQHSSGASSHSIEYAPRPRPHSTSPISTRHNPRRRAISAPQPFIWTTRNASLDARSSGPRPPSVTSLFRRTVHRVRRSSGELDTGLGTTGDGGQKGYNADVRGKRPQLPQPVALEEADLDFFQNLFQKQRIMDYLEERLEFAKKLHGEVVDLQMFYGSGTVAAMRDLRATAIPRPLPQDNALFREVDLVLVEIQRFYKELDKFWKEEIYYVAEALKTGRTDPRDPQYWNNFSSRLNLTIDFWKNRPPSIDAHWQTLRSDNTSSSTGGDLGAIALSLSPTIGFLEDALERMSSSDTLRYSHLGRSCFQRVYVAFAGNSDLCCSFLRHCADYGEKVLAWHLVSVGSPTSSRVVALGEIQERPVGRPRGRPEARPEVTGGSVETLEGVGSVGAVLRGGWALLRAFSKAALSGTS